MLTSNPGGQLIFHSIIWKFWTQLSLIQIPYIFSIFSVSNDVNKLELNSIPRNKQSFTCMHCLSLIKNSNSIIMLFHMFSYLYIFCCCYFWIRERTLSEKIGILILLWQFQTWNSIHFKGQGTPLNAWGKYDSFWSFFIMRRRDKPSLYIRPLNLSFRNVAINYVNGS